MLQSHQSLASISSAAIVFIFGAPPETRRALMINLVQWMAGARGRAVGLPSILALGAIGLMVLAATKASSCGGPSIDGLGAVFLASTLSSIAGFAFSAICGARLFHLLDNPVMVVQVMIVCSIAIQFFNFLAS